jgi:hypothetical protein
MAPAGLPLAVVVAVLWIIVAVRNKQHLLGLFVQRSEQKSDQTDRKRVEKFCRLKLKLASLGQHLEAPATIPPEADSADAADGKRLPLTSHRRPVAAR